MAFLKSMPTIAVEKENRTLSLACLLCKVSIWSKITSGYEVFFLVPDPPLTDTIPVDVRNVNLALRPCSKSTKEFAQHLRRASFNWKMQTLFDGTRAAVSVFDTFNVSKVRRGTTDPSFVILARTAVPPSMTDAQLRTGLGAFPTGVSILRFAVARSDPPYTTSHLF